MKIIYDNLYNYIHDRDGNASENILKQGIKEVG